MPVTAREVIIYAYRLSNIVERFGTVSGVQVNDGLEILNDFLSLKRVDAGLIPYYTRHKFTTVVGQESYFIENLVEADTATFELNNLRYSLAPVQHDTFFGSTRPTNINSLMVQWSLLREHRGARVFFWFKPSQAFEVELLCKFGLLTASLNTDLSLHMDNFYITYVKYGLACFLCSYYSTVIDPDIENRFIEMENSIRELSPKDFTIKKLSTFGRPYGINYGITTFATDGWLPYSS